MKKVLTLLVGATVVAMSASVVMANPADDVKAFQGYFEKKFDTKFEDYKNGVYAVDPASREQWLSIEEFPPYEDYVDMGEAEWGKKFANGKTYASCFDGKAVGDIRPAFPHWDAKNARVQTLESALNECREANAEKPLKWKKGKMAYLSAYLGKEASGKKINVVVPNDPKAQAAYEAGKKFFYAKRGQLNLSCADCHVYNSGMKVRADNLSPALGHTTHFPVFRGKWAKKNGDGFGTLHRRFGGCNKNVRAKPFKAQGTEYRNLEYFLATMGNGLEINAERYRK